MSKEIEYKTQKHFVKDGDDAYLPRRPRRSLSPTQSKPRQPYTKCECGGKLKPRGSIGSAGQTSAKCNKCGKRVYTKHYRGREGLVRCY